MMDRVFDVLPFDRVKTWLRVVGIYKEDSLWYVPRGKVLSRLLDVLRWELNPEQWFVNKKGTLFINVDWYGDMSESSVLTVGKEMDIIGTLFGSTGWLEFRECVQGDINWIAFNLPEYGLRTK
jgi:hypothetical protein